MDTPAADVDVLVVGAGITGIYQVYRARQEGFSVLLLEAGTGVGGTWFWNRYPGARFDSESYTYGYSFSKELLDEWHWKEKFSGQPELESYFNEKVLKSSTVREFMKNAEREGPMHCIGNYSHTCEKFFGERWIYEIKFDGCRVPAIAIP